MRPECAMHVIPRLQVSQRTGQRPVNCAKFIQISLDHKVHIYLRRSYVFIVYRVHLTSIRPILLNYHVAAMSNLGGAGLGQKVQKPNP